MSKNLIHMLDGSVWFAIRYNDYWRRVLKDAVISGGSLKWEINSSMSGGNISLGSNCGMSSS